MTPHSPARSSSALVVTSSPSAAWMSESLIRPKRLQALTHIHAHVDWAERWLWIWESTRRPWLNTRSMSTVEAEKNIKLCSNLEQHPYQEWTSNLEPYKTSKGTYHISHTTTSMGISHSPHRSQGNVRAYHSSQQLWGPDQGDHQRCSSMTTKPGIWKEVSISR